MISGSFRYLVSHSIVSQNDEICNLSRFLSRFQVKSPKDRTYGAIF
ncbi:hypothetical protein L21SP2_0771 [Salinispira pacifica]|uniref:Uncharacterized protein n=1 Tax=Salinispira pacifica TaxID=1307761 RepID=V5WEF4_9SPIO|nr:hypothetical protein L21SP2_0771 [Salinispira pacifica]